MALHRGHQAEHHRRRLGARQGAVPRSDPQRLDLCPGLLRTRGERDVRHARRGRGTGPEGLPSRHDEQVVSPVLRTGAHLRRALRRGAEGLPPPADGEPEGPRQLSHPGSPLRAEAKPRHGSRDARLGRTALRTHPPAERHETAPAGGDEPDRQSRGRSPGNGRSRTLRGAAPRGPRRPLRHRQEGFAGPVPNTTVRCRSTPRTCRR